MLRTVRAAFPPVRAWTRPVLVLLLATAFLFCALCSPGAAHADGHPAAGPGANTASAGSWHAGAPHGDGTPHETALHTGAAHGAAPGHGSDGHCDENAVPFADQRAPSSPLPFLLLGLVIPVPALSRPRTAPRWRVRRRVVPLTGRRVLLSLCVRRV